MMSPGPYLVVIGPPGAGKSVLGMRVAKLLRVPFIDTDRRIVAQHGPIPQIFARRGEDWFREAERAEVVAALRERAVVALGGGAVLDPRTRSDLAAARVVLVTVSPEAVGGRIRDGSRPLLAGGLDSWVQLMQERRPLYEQLATRTVDSSQRSPASLAHELADWVQKEERQ